MPSGRGEPYDGIACTASYPVDAIQAVPMMQYKEARIE